MHLFNVHGVCRRAYFIAYLLHACVRFFQYAARYRRLPRMSSSSCQRLFVVGCWLASRVRCRQLGWEPGGGLRINIIQLRKQSSNRQFSRNARYTCAQLRNLVSHTRYTRAQLRNLVSHTSFGIGLEAIMQTVCTKYPT